MSQIRVELQLEDKSFVTGILRAGQSLQDFKNELARVNPHFRTLREEGKESFIGFQRHEEVTRSLGQRLRDLSIVATGAAVAFHSLTGASNGIIGSIVRTNAEMEKLRYQLAGMSNAAEPMKEATQQLSDLQKLSSETPFAFNELTNSFVKMQAAGLKPTINSMRALTDGLASFGASNAQLHRVTIALTQMQGKGVLSMEELRQQLGESMPNAMQMFARSMNVTVGELSKLVSTGTVESTSAIQKFLGELERTYGGTGKFMMRTFSGEMARIKTAWTSLVTGGPERDGEMARAFEMLEDKMGDLADFLESTKAREFFDSIGVGLQKVIALVDYLKGSLLNLGKTLIDWSKWIALAFAGGAVLSAIRSFTTSVLAIRAAWQGVSAASLKARLDMASAFALVSFNNKAQLAQIGAQAAALAAAQKASGTFAIGPASSFSPTVVAATRQTAGNIARMGVSLTGFVSAGARFLGVLGPIGLAVGALLPVVLEVGKGLWDWATGADKANEKLQLTAQQQLAQLKAERAQQRNNLSMPLGHAHDAEMAKQILAEFDKETDRILSQFINNSVEAQTAEAKSHISAATREISKSYGRAMADLDTQYQEELQRVEKADGDVNAVRDKYARLKNEARIERQGKVIAVFDKEIATLKKLSAEYKISPEILADFIEERDRLVEEMKDWKPEDFRPVFVTSVDTDEKKAKRLERYSQSAADKFEELKAQIGGASGEFAKLIAQIERGDFGNFKVAADDVLEMRDGLVQTTLAVEALNKVLKDLNEANSEIERINENVHLEGLKIQARIDGVDPTDEFEFYEWRRKNGKIAGLGDPNQVVQDAMTSVTKGVDLSSEMFRGLGDAIKTQAFGEESRQRVAAIETHLMRVRDLANEIRGGMSEPMPFGAAQAWAMSGGANSNFRPMPGFTQAVQGAMGNDWLKYSNQGATRNQPISQQLAQAMSFLKEMGIQMEVFSGGQDAEGPNRVGSHRHDHGMAADVFFNQNGRRLSWENAQDIPIFQEIVRRAKLNGVTGFGAGPGYMQPGSMHVGYGAPTVWGASTGFDTAPQWLRDAFAAVGPLAVEAVEAGQKRESETFEDTKAQHDWNEANEPRALFADTMRKLDTILTAQTKGMGDDDAYGTNERNVRELIASGKLKGISQPEIDKVVAAAIAADKHVRDLQERRKDKGELEDNRAKLEEQRRETEQRRLEAMARASDPNYKGRSSEMKAAEKLAQEQLALAEKLFGKGSKEYTTESNRIEQQLSDVKRADAAEAYADLMKEAHDAEKGAIIEERDLRQREFDDRIAQLETIRDRAIADGVIVADAQKAFDRAVAAERAKFNRENRTELQQQIEEMAKYGENINKAAGGWAKNLSDALYEGKGFQGFANAIRESIARSLTDAAAAAFMKPFEKMIAGDGTKGSGLGGLFEKMIGGLTGGDIFGSITKALSGVAKSATSFMTKGKGKGATVGVKHTGGVVGVGGGWSRPTHVANFLGAPKYHTGGIVGKTPFRHGLSPSEVPIIAKKGEGVFTPEQMKHLGATVNSSSISISAPVTVNATGGTQEQNADLAYQVAQQTERMMRNIVNEELVRHMRPGGMLR